MKKFHMGVELAGGRFSLYFDELNINSNSYMGFLTALLGEEDEKLKSWQERHRTMQ